MWHFDMCRLRRASAASFLKPRNSKWCSVNSLTVIEYSNAQRRLCSDCAYAQADLRLCWSHIPHFLKYHALAHFQILSPLLPIACWEFLHASLLAVKYFTKLTLKKFSGILSERQSVLTQIRYDILSGLIWVQTVCKGYQQTVLSDRELIGLVLVRCLQMGH